MVYGETDDRHSGALVRQMIDIVVYGETDDRHSGVW